MSELLTIKALDSLMAFWIFFSLLSFLISFFVKNEKNKKVIYAFCVSLFVWYIISCVIVNFYNISKKGGYFGDFFLAVMLIVPSLISTLIYWYFVLKRKK